MAQGDSGDEINNSKSPGGPEINRVCFLLEINIYALILLVVSAMMSYATHNFVGITFFCESHKVRRQYAAPLSQP